MVKRLCKEYPFHSIRFDGLALWLSVETGTKMQVFLEDNSIWVKTLDDKIRIHLDSRRHLIVKLVLEATGNPINVTVLHLTNSDETLFTSLLTVD